MNRTTATLALSVLTGGALLAQGRSARAQQWEIEVHGGGLLSSTPRDGRSQMPPGAGTVATLSGGTSPRVTSWYFGDGSSLLNQVSTSYLGPQLTALDPVLGAPALERGDGGSVGFRLGRRLNRRLTIEGSFDYNLARLELSRQSLAGIEASRASFIRVWDQQVFFNPSVSSDATIDARGGRQFLATGALNVSLAPGRKVEPYLTVGGGLVSGQGNALRTTLEGRYQIRIAVPPPANLTLPFDEADRVTLRFSRESSWLALVGVGFKCRISQRWGVRVDIREHLSANRTSTRLDATPSTARLTPSAALSYLASPGLQLVNDPAVFRTESTLSGPAIAGFEAFKGTGLQSQLSITGGLFLRF